MYKEIDGKKYISFDGVVDFLVMLAWKNQQRAGASVVNPFQAWVCRRYVSYCSIPDATREANRRLAVMAVEFGNFSNDF